MGKMKHAKFYGVKDVCNFFECSQTKSYKIIRQLNKELEEKGFITYSGKVPVSYFNKRYYSD